MSAWSQPKANPIIWGIAVIKRLTDAFKRWASGEYAREKAGGVWYHVADQASGWGVTYWTRVHPDNNDRWSRVIEKEDYGHKEQK